MAAGISAASKHPMWSIKLCEYKCLVSKIGYSVSKNHLFRVVSSKGMSSFYAKNARFHLHKVSLFDTLGEWMRTLRDLISAQYPELVEVMCIMEGDI